MAGTYHHHTLPDGTRVYVEADGSGRTEEAGGPQAAAEDALAAGADPFGLTEGSSEGPAPAPPSAEALLDAAKKLKKPARRKSRAKKE